MKSGFDGKRMSFGESISAQPVSFMLAPKMNLLIRRMDNLRYCPIHVYFEVCTLERF